MGLAKTAQHFLTEVYGSSAKLDTFEKLPPLLTNVGLSLSSFEFGKIIPNRDCALSHLKGEKYINPKYLQSKTSKKTSPANIFRSIKEMFGEQLASSLLSTLQVSEEYLLDKNEAEGLSIELSNDMFSIIKQMNPLFSPNLLGMNFFDKLVNSPFYNSFKGKTNTESHEILFEEVAKHLEKSYNYELIKLNSKVCVFRKHPSQEVQDTVGKQIYYDKTACDYQKGIASSISMINSNLRSKVSETRCVHEGDPYCQFEIQFCH